MHSLGQQIFAASASAHLQATQGRSRGVCGCEPAVPGFGGCPHHLGLPYREAQGPGPWRGCRALENCPLWAPQTKRSLSRGDKVGSGLKHILGHLVGMVGMPSWRRQTERQRWEDGRPPLPALSGWTVKNDFLPDGASTLWEGGFPEKVSSLHGWYAGDKCEFLPQGVDWSWPVSPSGQLGGEKEHQAGSLTYGLQVWRRH